MPIFLVRRNCEYSIEIMASDADEAMNKAGKVPDDQWGQAWSDWETECDDESEE